MVAVVLDNLAEGMTPEQVVTQCPPLTLADVRAAMRVCGDASPRGGTRSAAMSFRIIGATTGKSNGPRSFVFTISRVAEMLGEDEEWLDEMTKSRWSRISQRAHCGVQALQIANV
jgi:hypothetical protein